MPRILVQHEDFDAGAELARLNAAGVGGVGGVGSFVGLVRGEVARDEVAHNEVVRNESKITALHLEHYPAMTARALTKIANEAMARWPLHDCTIIHRVGTLHPGENIVFVAAASAHREAALQATAFLIDWLKTSAPFWKREDFASGVSTWVAAREADETAASEWVK